MSIGKGWITSIRKLRRKAAIFHVYAKKNQHNKLPTISSRARASMKSSPYFRPGTFINRNINYVEVFVVENNEDRAPLLIPLAIREIDVISSDCAR